MTISDKARYGGQRFYWFEAFSWVRAADIWLGAWFSDNTESDWKVCLLQWMEQQKNCP